MTLTAKKARLTGQLKAGKVKFSAVEIADADLTEINNAIDAINGEVITGQALDKLAVTDASKADIKAAIEAYAVDVDDAPLSAYAGLIEDIGDSVEATFKTALDAANEEVSADLTAGIALVDSNYGDIKAAITAAGVDMTGTIPSEYDASVAQVAFEAATEFDVATKTITKINSAFLSEVEIPVNFPGILRKTTVEIFGLQCADRHTTTAGNLGRITLPDATKEIRGSAFRNCGISGQLEIPNGTLIVDPYAFQTNLITRLDTPPSLKIIGNRAFQFNNITVFNFAEGLEKIEDSAFQYNYSGTTITFPASLQVIEQDAFNGVYLVIITIGAGVTLGAWQPVGPYSAGFVSLYNGNGKLAGTYQTLDGTTWTKTA